MNSEFVLVSAGDRRKLVRLSDIREIIPMMALQALDGQRGACRGMVNLRGEVIPVFDLRGPSALLLPSRFILVCPGETSPLGLIVDEIHDVVAVPAENLSSRPVGGGRKLAVARLKDEILPVLEPSGVTEELA